ncbi:MAG: type I restriction endonuclease subunit R [Halanaerobiales bacterium]
MARSEQLKEKNISQTPAIDVLTSIGYTYIEPNECEILRENKYNVILKDILRKKLIDLNTYNYKGTDYKFSEKNISQAMLDLNEALTDGLIKTNEKIYDTLMLGRSYQEDLPDGKKQSFDISFIDWETPDNNVYHVTEEFSIEREDASGFIRPDIVLFVNGIPFGVIECKRSSISINKGIEQMIRNQSKDYIPQLFKFIQIVMCTNKNATQYATTGTPKKFWSIWKEEEEEWLNSILEEIMTDRLPTVQDKNIISLFHPSRLLDITRFFVLYDNDVKKIARYQQFFAVQEIIETINKTEENNNRQSGVIWHTQGSGKSLTMVMLAKYILSQMTNCNPQVIVVTDRINLDKQIRKTFTHTRLKAYRATSGKHLVTLLNDNNADIITTLVHKFDTAVNNQKPIESKDIFVLVDESHRTHYGELHTKMKLLFPNACYLGFTGTPLMKKEKNTMIKFGRLIHKYTIADGVNDKIIVPLLYEGKMVEQTVNQKAIDNQLNIITRHLNEKQKLEVSKKWSMFERIASSDQRIKLIAFDINEHFMKNYKTQGAHFKGMLATNSRAEAIRYLEAFEDLGDLNTAVVISPPDQREGQDEVDVASEDIIQNFWGRMMKKYNSPERYEDEIKDEFINGDDIDILIVVDKLLTGFDAPRATVLYVDKSMKEHTLLQAIARVNRLYEGKDYGFIVDYRGLLDKLDEAMEIYSGAGLENFDPGDLKGAIYDVISIVGSLRQYYTELINIFQPVKNKNDVEEYEVLLENEDLRKEFYNVLSKFGRTVAIALESDNIYKAIGQDELNQYKKTLKFYQELRRSVKIRYSDSIDHKEYEAKMQKLMDNYIAAEEVIRITNPVDIMDKKKFDEELDRLDSSRGKADAIKTRLTKRIEKHWDENPAYYKKFSEKIEETLKEYKDKRITDAEYLRKMRDIMDDFRKGSEDDFVYPDNIKNNKDAKAFYGVIKDVIAQDDDTPERANLLGDLAIDIDIIIDKHSKVDWHNNVEVHKKIEQEIDDLTYLYQKKYGLSLSLKEVDKIISDIKTVALRRASYKYRYNN